MTATPALSPWELRRTTDVLRAVMAESGVDRGSLFSRRRTARVAAARQLAMALLRDATNMSLAEIGSIFGRGHDTAIHAIRAVKARRVTDLDLDRRYLFLLSRIRAATPQP